jgi:ATP-dependent RNA helicase DDX49/DBP8
MRAAKGCEKRLGSQAFLHNSWTVRRKIQQTPLFNVPMAASPTIRHVSDEGPRSSDYSDSDSDSDSDSPSDSTHGLSGSESLDSQAARKRRRLSPVEDDEPFVPRLAVPSRTARGKPTVLVKTGAIGTNNGAVLAPTDPQTTFAALDVKPWLVGSLGAMAIKRPTGIQKHCIPEILKGRDCIGGSRTGSGKTMAFAVPILQKWAEDPFGIFALVLTPTRYDFNGVHGVRQG